MTDMMDAESFESVEKSIFREAGNTDTERIQTTIFREAGNTDAIVQQTPDRSSLPGLSHVDALSLAVKVAGSGHPVYEALNERIQTLEDFNTKLLAALKQHGFDVVKLFR